MLKFLIPLLFLAQVAMADVSVPRSKQYAWFVYDTSTSGGGSVAHAMGLTLPGPAVITNVWVYINTQFAASGTESLGVSCLGSQDVMAYAPIKSIAADRLLAGSISGTAFTGAAAPIPATPTTLNLSQGFASVPTSAGCDVIVNVRGDAGYTPYTAGKLTGIVEYFKF